MTQTTNGTSSATVRLYVAEIIDSADRDVLDLMRSRGRKQEVLDLLNEPHVQVKSGWWMDAQGLGSLPVVRLERKLGTARHDAMTRIKQTLRACHEISFPIACTGIR